MASNLFLKPGQSVDDTLPNRDVVQRVFGLSVKDADGIEHPIQSLVAQHVILVFVRHHHCGMCMHYIADLAQDQRFASGSTKVIVIGHGSYQGIQRYKEVSKCPFEMYVDETKQVYEALGLTRRFLGKDHSEEAGYLHGKSALSVTWESVKGMVSSGSLAWKGGDIALLGGEFVFDQDGTCVFAHRMRDTTDHTEVSKLAEYLPA